MAISALRAAASGMAAMDTKLNVVANNLANIDTVGFKRSRVNFEDVLYDVRREPGAMNALSQETPYGILVGLGSQVSGTQLDFEYGAFDQTGKPYDLAIQGDGFFQVKTNYNGQEITAYTRAGNFTKNREGQVVLANSEGSPMEPPLQIPADASDPTFSSDGKVSVRQPGATTLTQVGQVQLSRFVNPEGLLQIGKNLYIETDASGPPVQGNPQQNGLGEIKQSTLEQSNVDPVIELVDLIFTQRGFEINSQSIQAADRTLEVISRLGRF